MGTNLTEKDVRKILNDLWMKDYVKPRDPKTGRFLPGPMVRRNNDREYVCIAGQGFMDMVDESLKKLIK